MEVAHKSAFVAVVGRPSAGKSTLMNTICGEKVAIVSPVPQTTRNTVRGILTRPDCQLVFLDTPGLHDSDKAMNKRLEEEAIASLLVRFAAKTFAAVNKIDARESDVSKARLFLMEKLPGLKTYDISAEKGSGVDALIAALQLAAPEGPAYYPDDFYTDQEPVFRIAEIVREKVFLHTRDELPHAVYVDYVSHHMLDDGTLVYEGILVVERESQKGIVIGKGGAMIQQLREEAEKDLNDIFPYPVRLSLKVKVDPHWKRDEKLLKRLIQ
jgi:GTP-binding protein Era